jgi:hypothetical protein
VQAAALALVVGTHDEQRAVVALLDGDRLGDGVREGALGALDRDQLAVEGDLDAAGTGTGRRPIRDMRAS